MIADYDDDTHFCLKCHLTILGLENYVTHRKSGCSKNETDPSKSPLPSHLLPPDEIGLKADDFFSSLELRSSSKKTTQSTSGKNISGVLTRSKTTAVIQAATSSKDQPEAQQSKSGKNVWIGGNQIKDLGTGDNESKLIKAVANLERRKDGTTCQSPPRIGSVYEESEDDSVEYDYDEDETSEEDYAPPRNYTGGKWKPNSPIQWTNRGTEREWNVPPPSYTGGKWKPRRPPSPSYTKGKWKPSEDDGLSTGGKHPPLGHTRGKWKPPARNEHEEDYPPPSHTKGKWKPKSEIDDDRFPPPSHTKGKWKPRTEEDSVPPPTHSKGKWKPKVELDEIIPPSTYTKGKWKPKLEAEAALSHLSIKLKEKTEPDTQDSIPQKASETITSDDSNVCLNEIKGKHESMDLKLEDSGASTHKSDDESSRVDKPKPKLIESKTTKQFFGNDIQATPNRNRHFKISDDSPFRKSSGTIQYWCSTCNRRLASKIVYERHLKSDLHFKRSRPEREFDDGAMIKSKKMKVEAPEIPCVAKEEPKQLHLPEKKRNRKRTFEICAVCNTKVNKYIMGKHLISHYHCRKGDISTDVAKKLVLENIYSIVLESPYQCGVCRFYCNTHEEFLEHWKSNFHKSCDQKYNGYFLCAFCKHRDDNSEEMFEHLKSAEHLEVVSVINRSVPIAIKKINQLSCNTCHQKFTLNIQLLNHCRRLNHDNSNVSILSESDFKCKECDKSFLNALSIQRHIRKKHKRNYSFCSVCDLKFDSFDEAKEHRKTSKHRYACLEKKKPKDASLRRKCEYCEKYFANFLLLKNHLKEEHPDHKVRCPYCGMSFTVTQELSNHMKSKSCKFPETKDSSENPYQCEKCHFSSDSTSELLYHLALHDEPLVIYPLDSDGNVTNAKPIPRYKCTTCKKFFPKHSLLPHIRLHTEERPYFCKICNASFARKNNLLYHEKNHERKNSLPRSKVSKEKKPFLCSTCGAGFGKRFTLQQHMLTHTGKVCRCPEIGCFYTARKLSELKEHFKIHSEEKNFSCDLCEYKGKTRKQLKRHLTIHEPTKKYHCSLCTFTSRTAAHLKRHVRLHTGAKPYSCPHCDYKCNSLENLRRHVLSTTKHPGKCIYECKFCTKFDTNLAKDFKNHLLLYHNEVFGNVNEAASYVAGIYQAHEDRTYLVDMESVDNPENNQRISSKTDPSEDILKLQTKEDPVVAQLLQSAEVVNKDQSLDQMLPMFIIPKDDSGNVEITPDSWSLIGRYDVEESGTLVPFHSGEEEELFHEHF